MAEFSTFGTPPRSKLIKTSSTGVRYIDYREADDLRRLMTPNGKIQTRKRTGLNAQEQRMAAQAIKRARYMGLLPYTSATL
jgi:small subunit ribosomal protein S18